MIDPERTCPDGFAEWRIAALAAGDADSAEVRECLEHLEGCGTCAGLYAAHVKLIDLAVADARGEGGVEETRGRKSGRIRSFAAWCRRPANAAAVLLALLCGVAGGALLPGVRGVFVGQSDQSSVGLWTTRGYDFEALGVSGSARVIQDSPYATGGRAVGTLFAVEERPGRGVNLCAFDERGNAVWSAERAWDDYPEVAGRKQVRFVRLVRLNSAKRAGALDESFMLVLARGLQTGLVLFNPRTGERRWSLFYDGLIRDVIQTMPEEEDGSRPVLVGGHRGDTFLAEPVLLVVGGDGRVRQQLVLPVLMKGKQREAAVLGIWANWRTEPVHVRLGVSGGLLIGFDWRDGRLDTASATVVRSDRFTKTLESEYSTEQLEKILEEFGGIDGWPETLGSAIRDVRGGLLPGWR